MILHILPRGKYWAVKREGAERASRRFRTKRQATHYAGYADQVYLHQRNGVITDVSAGERNILPTQRIHVLKDDRFWSVKTAGVERAIKRFSNKHDAEQFAARVAKRRRVPWAVQDNENTLSHIDFPREYRIAENPRYGERKQW